MEQISINSSNKARGCIMNYSGNKHRYFKELSDILPEEENLQVLDVFSGGGVISTSLPESWGVLGNDKESRLVDIHRAFQYMLSEHSPSEVARYITNYCHSEVMDKKDEQGFEGLKRNYNLERTPLALYALVTASNSNYMRFNKSGEFNIKFGKRYLNTSLQSKLVNYMERVAKRDITWQSEDFREYDFSGFDLVICDPPYSYANKSTATYNESGGWTLQDCVNLLAKLDRHHEKGGKFIFFNEVVTKNQDNAVIKEWCNKYNLTVLRDTTSSCNYQRTDKRSVEVMVTNY